MSLLSPEIETIFELPVPRELCGMDRGEFTDFESRQPGLGYSVAYSSNDGQLTVYIYDGGDPNVSSDLRSDATWNSVTNQPSTGEVFSIILAPSRSQQFYRLRLR